MQKNYFIKHILPSLIESYNSGREERPHLLDLYYIKQLYKDDTHAICWNDINVEHHPISQEKSVGIYSFKYSEHSEGVKYALIFFDYNDRHANLYLLEHTEGDEAAEEWQVMYQKDEEEAINFGPFILQPTTENLINFIIQVYEPDYQENELETL